MTDQSKTITLSADQVDLVIRALSVSLDEGFAPPVALRLPYIDLVDRLFEGREISPDIGRVWLSQIGIYVDKNTGPSEPGMMIADFEAGKIMVRNAQNTGWDVACDLPDWAVGGG
ncbi:hypothetical protein [Paremcibacter congregatus]|uniref:hypothetical protein n=1 Tax=Paremcibacter congregatus TaxID=2043170 RepID=UPI003A8F6501